MREWQLNGVVVGKGVEEARRKSSMENGKRRRDKNEAETRVPGYRTQRLVPSAGKLSLPHLPFGLGRPREGAWMAPARCHLLARGLA